MLSRKSLKTNFIMNAVLTASSFIFPLITFPYVSRILLPVGMGKITFTTSIAAYFSMAAMLGIPTYGIRACSRVRDNSIELSRTVHEIFFINFIMTVFVYTIFFICLFEIPQFKQEKFLYIICSSSILFNLLGMEWLYKALEEYQYITTRSILFKFLSVVLMFALVHNQKDYVIYGAITIFASVGSNIVNFINVRKYIKFGYIGSYNFRQHLKPIFTFFALTVTTTIYTNMDIIMLGFMKGNLEVGYYNSAIKIKAILVTLVTSLSTVLLPRVSYYVEKNLKNEIMVLTEKALKFVILISLPLCVYFSFMAEKSILLLSGTAFLGSVQPMQIIMPTIIFIGLTNIIGIQLLVPHGKEHLVLYSTCVGAFVDIVLNALLIPKLGVSGAAIGTLIAEFVVLMIQLFFIRNDFSQVSKNLQLYKILFSSLAASSIMIFIRNINTGSIFIDLLLTSSVFFGVYILFIALILHYKL